jgi:SAM-dependent methyltransferase
VDQILRRTLPPEPWTEGDNIPWNRPDFSKRMLREHLSQAHDAASRRLSTVEHHVGWIHRDLLKERPSRVFDVACGPGLYANRLARRGHDVTGIDYSPASIRYATEEARNNALPARFIEADIRTADFGGPYDLAMLISGEVNVFQPEIALDILRRMCASLDSGGSLLLEGSSAEAVKRKAARDNRWYTVDEGLWLDRPHLVLEEAFWDEPTRTATVRYFVVDLKSASTEQCTVTYQAYDEGAYRELLTAAGFTRPELVEAVDEWADPAMRVMLAGRR